MARIVFYCRVKRDLLDSVEFYKQDIDALRGLGHEVLICTKYREIPLRFDAIFVWWWTYAAWPTLFAKLAGKPSIVTGVLNFRFPPGFRSMDYVSRPWYQRLLIYLAVKAATMNVFISRFEWEACSDHFKLSSARYCHLSLGSDYLQGPGDNRELAILNISWSGRHNLVRKGVPELLEAAKLLKEEGHGNIKIYLAGHRGDGFEDLKAHIAESGLSDNVLLLGEISRSEKIQYLRKCEIYAQPSQFEGFGLAMAEAMGSGACVVTCNVGAVEEVVGEAGLYVQPGSARELADALRKLLTDRQLRTGFQDHALERARRMFSQGMKESFWRETLDALKIS